MVKFATSKFIQIGTTYRLLVIEHPTNDPRGSYLDFYPEYFSHEPGRWCSIYDNAWLAHFSNFWKDQPQDAEERARNYVYQCMEYALIEVALQKYLNPDWHSYQENHNILFDCPPSIADPQAYIEEQLVRLNSGWQHVWGFTKSGRITRAIVPPSK